MPTPRYLRFAGLVYLVDFVTAGIAPSDLLPRLVAKGDAVTTAANIAHFPWMLRLAVAGDLVTVLCEVLLCAVFYAMFRPVDRTLAALMAFFRLAYTALVTANILNLYAPLRLLGGDASRSPCSCYSGPEPWSAASRPALQLARKSSCCWAVLPGGAV